MACIGTQHVRYMHAAGTEAVPHASKAQLWYELFHAMPCHADQHLNPRAVRQEKKMKTDVMVTYIGSTNLCRKASDQGKMKFRKATEKDSC